MVIHLTQEILTMVVHIPTNKVMQSNCWPWHICLLIAICLNLVGKQPGLYMSWRRNVIFPMFYPIIPPLLKGRISPVSHPSAGLLKCWDRMGRWRDPMKMPAMILGMIHFTRKSSYLNQRKHHRFRPLSMCWCLRSFPLFFPSPFGYKFVLNEGNPRINWMRFPGMWWGEHSLLQPYFS
jgi:hypothetical protein